jgi:hypothetical protein
VSGSTISSTTSSECMGEGQPSPVFGGGGSA